jgi:hypothetical protein
MLWFGRDLVLRRLLQVDANFHQFRFFLLAVKGLVNLCKVACICRVGG